MKTISKITALGLVLGLMFSAALPAHAEPFAYVTNFTSRDVSVIDTDSNTVVDTVAVGSGPRGVAITPDGAFAYVTNLNSHNVSVIDTDSNTVVDTVAVGNAVGLVAITPDGAFAYVAIFTSIIQHRHVSRWSAVVLPTWDRRAGSRRGDERSQVGGTSPFDTQLHPEELTVGVEPTTCCLQGSCSTN